MLSILCERSEIASALDRGVDDYVVKPFALEELLARVNSLVRRSETMRFKTTALHTKNGVLDLKRHAFTMSSISIPLTPIEYRLLACLLLHQGSVVTKQDLERHAFSACTSENLRATSTHLFNLHKKT